MSPIELAIPVLSSVLAIAVSYGVTQAKLESIGKEQDRIWQALDAFVTRAYFDAIINTIQSNQTEMRQDVKELLTLVNRLAGK